MDLFYCIVVYLVTFFLSVGNGSLQRYGQNSERKGEKKKIHRGKHNNRLKYQRLLNKPTKHFARQKRQVQNDVNGVQHVYGGTSQNVNYQNEKYNVNPIDLSQSAASHHIYESSSTLNPSQVILPIQDHSSLHNYGGSPSLNPNEGPTGSLSQDGQEAPQDLASRHNYENLPSSNPSRDSASSLSQDAQESSQTETVNGNGPPNDPVQNVYPVPQHINGETSPVYPSSNQVAVKSFSDAPLMTAPSADHSVVISAEPEHIHVVKTFYPVDIVHRVPKPIPVVHRRFVPIPVHQKKINYYPQPYAQPFSHPDVHLSYIHMESRANPCQHGGIIVQSPGGYTCLCRKAFKGKHCQERDRCFPLPCKNDGNCVDRRTHYVCKCAKGFKGINCDAEDKCYNRVCKNGGTCVQVDSNIKCTCAAGYKGQFCQDIDHCHPNPCRNGGDCQEVNQEVKCTCTSSFKGHRCQVPTTCSPNLCRNGGTCLEEKPSNPCQCAPGFTGRYCTENLCQPNPCQHDGTCYPAKSDYPVSGSWYAACKCRNTYEGDRCQIANPCASNPSPCDHGICYDAYTSIEPLDLPPEGFTCHCYEGYYGSYCKDKRCAHCDVNAQCLNGQTCVCNDGYHGDGETCEKIRDPCKPNPCKHGGSCEPYHHTFVCNCLPGFKGKTCEDKEFCSTLVSPCKNGETCIGHNDGYDCTTCMTAACPETNSTNLCAGKRCLNGGTCKVTPDNKSWYCICKSNHLKAPDCACNCPENAHHPSERNLTCDNLEGVCACPRGFVHDRYRDVCDDGHSTGKCTSCNPNPCKNEATCVGKPYPGCSCNCEEGWTGKLCDEEVTIGRSKCDPNTCKNGGTCNIVNGTANCACPEGFTSQLCEKGDVCSPNPCLNGGSCVSVVHSYDCVCDQQFTGPKCQVDKCVKCDPANALCTRGKCVCKSGYVGNGYRCMRKRKVNSNICTTCHPVNAVCVNNNCQCKDGYTGNGYQCLKTQSGNTNQAVPWFKRNF